MYKKIIKNDLVILSFGSLVILLIIIIGIITSSSILKKETIDNQLIIAKLNSQFLAEELNQNINTMEIVIDNLSSVINLDASPKSINQKLISFLHNFPQIRSINILENKRIIYSSNELNTNIFVDDTIFYPSPLFDTSILRISTSSSGRDFSNTNKLLDTSKDNNSSLFLPILKQTYINNKRFYILIALNGDYILDLFRKKNKAINFKTELLRADRILLLSTNSDKRLGEKVENNNFIQETLEINNYSGIHNLNDISFISSYSLTKDYPLMLGVHLNYESSLLRWNERIYKFFIITIGILVVCGIIVMFVLLLYRKEKVRELNAERSQATANNKFKLLFENSHFLSATIDSNGIINDINKIGLSFLGKNIQELQEISFWDLPCWRGEEKVKISHIISNYTQYINRDIELKAIDLNEEERIFECIISLITDDESVKLLLVGIDITQKKEREIKLEQAYTVFNNTKDGIVITDKNTKILDINNSYEQITGYSKIDISNKTVGILKSNVHNENFYNDMWQDIKRDGMWEGEITNRKKNGDLFTEWLTINTIYNELKEVVNYIGIFSDITEQKANDKLLKEKEALLFQQSKLASMGEMIENIAHQWRQPLSIISTAASGMQIQKEMGILEDKDEIKNLGMINESCQHLSQTIDDFRDFLRTNKKLELFELDDTVNRAIKLLSSKFLNENINIIIEDRHMKVNGLKNELIQVIMNILNNARDVLEKKDIENKYLFINFSVVKEYVCIQFKDNGGGIPEDIIGRIFEPYFTTKHKSQGTGIGLYMSSEIIRNHMNGILVVKNEKFEYKGEKYYGACFEIKLPK